MRLRLTPVPPGAARRTRPMRTGRLLSGARSPWPALLLEQALAGDSCALRECLELCVHQLLRHGEIHEGPETAVRAGDYAPRPHDAGEVLDPLGYHLRVLDV